MPTIADIRQQYPQYGDMSDGALADALHSKFYSDMPRDQFDQKIGLVEPEGMRTSRRIENMVSNIPGSAVEFGKAVAQPFIHPVETAENIGKIGKGVLQKVGILSGEDSKQYADAVGKFFMDRYGSLDAIDKTMEKDPVGFLSDLSTALTGGGALAARAPGVIGKVGEAASAAGRAVDPLSTVGKVATTAGKVGAEVVGGLTGTGGKSLRLAAEAGAEGGTAGKSFRESISGAETGDKVVADAKGALANLRQQRGEVYRKGMKDIGADNTVLDFNKIDAAVNKVQSVKKYGDKDLSPETAGIRSKIEGVVDDWRKSDPAKYHTAEGLDALKQTIGDIRDATEYGTPARVVADSVYNGIKQTIVDQAPAYAKVMKGYEEASTILKEIERTLSLKQGASIDSALRKLQSVLRNNVNTNYGNRTALAELLVNNGAPNLLTKLAGQSLNTWLPRGLGKSLLGPEAMGLGVLAVHNPVAAGIGAATLPLTSPKLMGLVAHGLGAGSRVAKPATRTLFNLGRESGLGQ